VTLPEFVLSIVVLAVTLYALLAGADFGAGFWDLTAGDESHGRRARDQIAHSIGPVWEANHVWLIFVLVVLWTCFPRVYASVASTLYVPLTLAAIGVILRGAGFVFRKVSSTMPQERFFGAMFASSSVVTPFCLGAIAGAVASGRVPPGIARGNVWTSWLNPTGILAGVLAVAVCAFIAAVFLCADAARRAANAAAARPDATNTAKETLELTEYFRRRALGSAVVLTVVLGAGLFVLRSDAPKLYHGLTHRGLPLVILSGIAGLTSIALLVKRSYLFARGAVVIAIAAVIWAWAAGQYPIILEPNLSIAKAAGATATLQAVVVCILAGFVVLVPSLIILFRFAQSDDATELEAPYEG
jgi:cytochrome d ubiquinol oxidase subunit II